MKTPLSLPPPRGPRLRKYAERAWHEAEARLLARRFETTNHESSQPVTGSAPVLVSLTTFGRRIEQVHLAVESIAAGDVRPQRLQLWLDDPALHAAPPAALRRLQDRGLEIGLTSYMGPHAKYRPAVVALAEAGSPLRLVTADDDIVYPRRWLRDLVAGAEATPEAVVAHYTRRVTFDEHGAVQPYRAWGENWSTAPSGRVFALGVSGVVYPPAMVAALHEAGEGFRTCTLRADDVWLHYTAARTRTPVRQLRPVATHFAALPAVDARLQDTNIATGGNDEQVAATYDAETLGWMASQP